MPPPPTTLLTDSLSILLQSPSSHDSLAQCPAPVLLLLGTHPESLIRLARSKLYTWPYAQVPACWRRLFVDASIVHAIRAIQLHVNEEYDRKCTTNEVESKATTKRTAEASLQESHHIREEDDWVQAIVSLLDMAIIMAGAEGRRQMVESILQALQQRLEGQHQVFFEPNSKRRKVDASQLPYQDRFHNMCNGSGVTVPLIQYPIISESAPSVWDFEHHLRARKGPLIIRNALAHWPALHDRPWGSPSYLMQRTFGGRRLVPVELGRSYTDEGWGQSILPFGKYMKNYLMHRVDMPKSLNKQDSNRHNPYPVNVSKGVTTNGVETSNDEELGVGYLAQHDLFSQIPSLRNDISIPDYCFTEPLPSPEATTESQYAESRLEEPLLNAWFGPAGTISPLHTDPYHNILCQVVGKKYIRLYNPDQTDKLYPRGTEGGVDMSNTSKLDVENDMNQRQGEFPLFHEAKYVETILEEGQCLYIPVGWWHYVRSLTVSFSVSFWWN